MYLIFSDADHTMYDRGPNSLSRENESKISQAQNQGAEFVVVTGNGYFPMIKGLAAQLRLRYVVTSTGAYIYDRQLEKSLFAKTLDPQVVDAVYQRLADQGLYFCAWTERDFYISPDLGDRLDAQHEIRLQMIGDLKVLPFDPAVPGLLNLLVIARPEKLVQAQKVAQELKLNWILVDEHTVAILPPEISKGFAVQWLAKHLGVSLEKVMTIGDSANDIPMLELPVYSYAVANADQKTKKAARFHAAAVEQNGLAYAIDDFFDRQKVNLLPPES